MHIPALSAPRCFFGRLFLPFFFFYVRATGWLRDYRLGDRENPTARAVCSCAARRRRSRDYQSPSGHISERWSRPAAAGQACARREGLWHQCRWDCRRWVAACGCGRFVRGVYRPHRFRRNSPRAAKEIIDSGAIAHSCWCAVVFGNGRRSTVGHAETPQMRGSSILSEKMRVKGRWGAQGLRSPCPPPLAGGIDRLVGLCFAQSAPNLYQPGTGPPDFEH